MLLGIFGVILIAIGVFSLICIVDVNHNTNHLSLNDRAVFSFIFIVLSITCFCFGMVCIMEGA